MVASLPVLGVRLWSSQQLGQGTVSTYTTTYDGTYVDDPLRTTVVVGDGQAFAALAQDPALRRPEVFFTDDLAAYRAQRPLLGYAAWALSAGQPRWVEPALLVMAIVGAGLLAMAAGLLLEDRGHNARLGALLELTPGVVASITGLVPEPLGFALALLGLWAYWRDRLVAAVVLLALAALTRETMLLVPAVLAVGVLRWRSGRSWRSGHSGHAGLGARRWDRLAALAAVPAVWAIWVVVVRARFGAWPWSGRSDRFTAPFVGFVQSLPDMRWPVVTLGCAAVAVALAVVCARRLRQDPLAPIALAYAVFGTVLSVPMWHRWDGFGRVLIPVYVLGGIVVMTATTRPRRQAEALLPEAEAAEKVAH